MNEVPEVLEVLVEFEEDDGSPISVCDPACRGSYVSYNEWEAEIGGVVMQLIAACPRCGSKLGYASDGRPYRIRFSRIVEALEQSEADLAHYKRALAWLLRELDVDECYKVECPRGLNAYCGGSTPELHECLVASALAATNKD